MNLQENIRRILREERKLSNFLRRRLEMLDYENEYPYDKIKDRYDTFFGNKINESVDKSEDKKLKLVKSIIYNMFDDIIDLEYNTERNEIMVYYDKQETLESSEICDIINDFTGLNVVPWYVYDKRVELKKEPDFYIDTERYEEEIYENYSPAGKEITPNKIVIHKSNPKFRDKIIEQGLKVLVNVIKYMQDMEQNVNLQYLQPTQQIKERGLILLMMMMFGKLIQQ